MALQGRTDQSFDEECHSVSVDSGKENCDDEAEQEAIRRHGGCSLAARMTYLANASIQCFMVDSYKTKGP